MHTDDFEWDPEKAQTNWEKHGVSFVAAQDAFLDDRAISTEDTFPFEQRFLLIGADTHGRVLVITYAWRRYKIRLISARKASNREMRQYKGE